MQRSSSLILASTLILGLLPTLAPPTEAARYGYSYGSGFRVGGLHFRIGYRHHDRGHYFRVKHRIRSPRYRCNDRCYIERDHHYHYRHCPVVHDYFYRNGHNPYELYARYAPRRYDSPRYDDGHYDSDRSYRSHRHPRHDRCDRRHRHYDD